MLWPEEDLNYFVNIKIRKFNRLCKKKAETTINMFLFYESLLYWLPVVNLI